MQKLLTIIVFGVTLLSDNLHQTQQVQQQTIKPCSFYMAEHNRFKDMASKEHISDLSTRYNKISIRYYQQYHECIDKTQLSIPYQGVRINPNM